MPECTEIFTTTSQYLDAVDDLSEKARQLSAMLRVISGAGYETFEMRGHDTKSPYLWGCAELSDQVVDMISKVAHMSCVCRAQRGTHV